MSIGVYSLIILGSTGSVHASLQRPWEDISSVAKTNTVCALLGLKTGFWATESRMLLPAKPAVLVKQCRRGAWGNGATIRQTGVPALNHLSQLKFRLRIQACRFLLARHLWSQSQLIGNTRNQGLTEI